MDSSNEVASTVVDGNGIVPSSDVVTASESILSFFFTIRVDIVVITEFVVVDEVFTGWHVVTLASEVAAAVAGAIMVTTGVVCAGLPSSSFIKAK